MVVKPAPLFPNLPFLGLKTRKAASFALLFLSGFSLAIGQESESKTETAQDPPAIRATIIPGYQPPEPAEKSAEAPGAKPENPPQPLLDNQFRYSERPVQPVSKPTPSPAAAETEPDKETKPEPPHFEKVEPLVTESPAELVNIGTKAEEKKPKPVAEAEKVASPRIAVAKPQPKPAPAPPKRSVSSWRTRYELGPGDALNFGIHGQPKLSKLAVPVAPDGTISFLQAKQIDVRGKTIDELRAAMNGVLREFHGENKLIITPAALGSKRYTVLGEVRNNGSFPLEKPTTLLNALATTGGFNLGSSGLDAIELADLRRSFIVRGGQRMDVDIEVLYLKGDLKHNVQLEPGDYVYIASKLRNEVYVFGAVNAPGVKPMEAGLTTLGAIAAANGFTADGWKDRVLVIRGRLDQPETKIAHLRQVMRGKETDFELQPGDIVYVHNRPWAFAEKLLDTAIYAYIDGAVAGALANSADVSVSR